METISIIFYNIWGQKVRAGKLKFDFENNILISGRGKEYNILSDREFAYKIQQGQIRAIGGSKGLYKFITEINKFGNPLNPAIDIFISL